MKFKFCGDLDCPDWILSEIFVLSKISSVRIKILANQVVQELLGGEIDHAKVAKLFGNDAKFELADVKAVIAATHFIVSKATKHDVDDLVLSDELQQLGLPKEHAEAFAKPYRENRIALVEYCKKKTLHLPQLDSVQWRLDYVLASSETKEVLSPSVSLQLGVRHQPAKPGAEAEVTSAAFEVPADKFLVLYHELKTAKDMMASLS